MLSARNPDMPPPGLGVVLETIRFEDPPLVQHIGIGGGIDATRYNWQGTDAIIPLVQSQIELPRYYVSPELRAQYSEGIDPVAIGCARRQDLFEGLLAAAIDDEVADNIFVTPQLAVDYTGTLDPHRIEQLPSPEAGQGLFALSGLIVYVRKRSEAMHQAVTEIEDITRELFDD